MSENKAMTGKALVFVRGHKRPSVAPLDAKYVRRLPDGEPMLAATTGDTIEAAMARWEKAQEKAQEKAADQKPTRKRGAKKEGDDDA